MSDKFFKRFMLTLLLLCLPVIGWLANDLWSLYQHLNNLPPIPGVNEHSYPNGEMPLPGDQETYEA